MSYIVTDKLVARGKDVKNAYKNALEISKAWKVEFHKQSSLLKTNKYILLSKEVFKRPEEAIAHLDNMDLKSKNINPTIAGAFTLTNNKYLFLSFERNHDE